MSAFRVAFRARGSFKRFYYKRQTIADQIVVACQQQSQSFCSNATQSAISKDEIRNPAVYFFNSKVLKHLMELNTKDIAKVFQRRKEGQRLKEPSMVYLTQEELDQKVEAAHKRARYFLQCPPVLLPRKEIDTVLSKDPELQGLDESKFIFTDVSFGLSPHERSIVARDPDGTLRQASWDERHRMNQIYFPVEGRSLVTPRLFETENVKSLLDRSEFEFLLDRACIQFEPDDPVYIRVASTTYEFVDQHNKYDLLRGTRHYGSMIFYLCFHGKIDNILLHCIFNSRIEEAVTIIKVFYLVREEPLEEKDQEKIGTDFILEYVESYSLRKPELRKMLQAYSELDANLSKSL